MTSPIAQELIHTFARKAIDYLGLVKVSLTIVTMYPVYCLAEDPEYRNYLHKFLFHYFMYFAKVMKIPGLYIPSSLTDDQTVELSRLASEIEKAIEPIDREVVNSGVLGVYRSETLREVSRIFKSDFLLRECV
jgi:hypothetical protein